MIGRVFDSYETDPEVREGPTATEKQGVNRRTGK